MGLELLCRSPVFRIQTAADADASPGSRLETMEPEPAGDDFTGLRAACASCTFGGQPVIIESGPHISEASDNHWISACFTNPPGCGQDACHQQRLSVPASQCRRQAGGIHRTGDGIGWMQ